MDELVFGSTATAAGLLSATDPTTGSHLTFGCHRLSSTSIWFGGPRTCPGRAQERTKWRSAPPPASQASWYVPGTSREVRRRGAPSPGPLVRIVAVLVDVPVGAPRVPDGRAERRAELLIELLGGVAADLDRPRPVALELTGRLDHGPTPASIA